MPVVETEWWSVEIPEEWRAEREENCVTIMDCDDIGALDISAVKKQGSEVDRDDLREFASEQLDRGLAASDIEIAGCLGIYFEYQEEDIVWREWFLGSGQMLLYATYNVERDNAGMDDVVVDQILSTLVCYDAES